MEYLKLTLTADDLVKHGFDKDQISYIKENIGCKETGLTLIKMVKILYISQNYPQCWVFKQPFTKSRNKKMYGF